MDVQRRPAGRQDLQRGTGGQKGRRQVGCTAKHMLAVVEQEQQGANEIRVESFYGTFSRSFSLPDNIDAKAIQAESKDGVLKVRIPKTKVAAPKAISIEVR